MAKRKITDYNKLFGAARKVCANPTKTNMARLEKASDRYIQSAVKKGKTKREAIAIVKKVTRCNLK